jgi:hypothetical protein
MTGMEPFQVAKATSTEGDGAESFRAREESQRSGSTQNCTLSAQHHTRSQARIES